MVVAAAAAAVEAAAVVVLLLIPQQLRLYYFTSSEPVQRKVPYTWVQRGCKGLGINLLMVHIRSRICYFFICIYILTTYGRKTQDQKGESKNSTFVTFMPVLLVQHIGPHIDPHIQ